MPYVEVSEVVKADLRAAYEMAKDMEAYPKYMESVISVKVADRDANSTITEWEAKVKGATLKWREKDEFDDANCRIHYRQIGGDLKKFEGDWIFDTIGEGETKITLTVDFEIGIPMFAAMLNPIASIVVKQNSQAMLRAIKEHLEGK